MVAGVKLAPNFEARKIGGFRAILKVVPLDGVVTIVEDHVMNNVALGILKTVHSSMQDLITINTKRPAVDAYSQALMTTLPRPLEEIPRWL